VLGALECWNDCRISCLSLFLNPKTMLVIMSLHILPKGYIAVYFYKNWKEHEIRLFDEDGQFQYIVEFPEELSKMYVRFTKNWFAWAENGADSDLYVEYKITNLTLKVPSL
ncbi:MAG: hypothetical protein KAW12_01855, partial [Candidatus Aminicenantes bacterium]|nr:hypothetical protein [Candidatus Aminicenantes bacterium]